MPEERKRGITIGRPGYRVLKSREEGSGARCLTFELDYPNISSGMQPRHRIMAAYEQKTEAPDRAWQYLLFAAEPYETVAFKIPSDEIDRALGRLTTTWDGVRKAFSLTMFYKDVQPGSQQLQQQHAKVQQQDSR